MAESESGAVAVRDDRELGTLAREMGKAYARTAAFYMSDMGKDSKQAEELARNLGGPNNQAAVADEPADQVSWWNLSGLAERDPEAAAQVWERVKAEARDELSSGHRAAEVVEWQTSPWDRARFLAMRTAFREEWVPQGGIEDSLLDSMALSFSGYLFWMGSINVQGYTENKRQTRDLRAYGRGVDPARLDTAEAIEMAANMADRFHKMFLRTLRALRDLRRYATAVTVQNAGQVNVGTQQWNVGR